MANVTEQTRTAQINSFTGGMNTDLHPLLQPNDTLTDCLNGTLITYNGNENMLQNDMGNYQLRNAKLPEGYIPMGMKEHQGILYLALYNPITKKVQLGSYPSPQTDFSKNGESEEYTINPIEIGKLECVDEKYTEVGNANPLSLSEKVWELIDNNVSKFLYSGLDLSDSQIIFTKDFSDESTFAVGDKYLISVDNGSSDELEIEDSNPCFQTLKYFSINKDKKIYDVDESDLEFVDTSEEVDGAENDPGDYKTVTWEQQGWLGAKYEIDNVNKIEQNVNLSITPLKSKPPRISKYTKPSNSSTYIHRFSLNDISGDYVLDLNEYMDANPNNLVLLDGSREISYDSKVELQDDFFSQKIAINSSDENELWFTGVKISKDTLKYQTLCSMENPKMQVLILENVTSENELPKFWNDDGIKSYWIKNQCNFDVLNKTSYSSVVLGSNATYSGIPNRNAIIYCKEGFSTPDDWTVTIKSYGDEDFNILDTFTGISLCYGFDQESSDIKIGLTGSWNVTNSIYTSADSDSLASLEALLKELYDKGIKDIIIPRKIHTSKLYSPNYIIPNNEDEYEFDCQNPVTIYTYNNKVSFSSDKGVVKKLFEFQFSNIELQQIGINTQWNNSVNIDDVKLYKSDNEILLDVYVKRNFEIQSDKFFNHGKFYQGMTKDKIHGVPINEFSLFYLSSNETRCNIETNSRISNHYFDGTFGIITYDFPPTEIKKVSTNIKEIILPDSISTINEYAFENCSELIHVEFPHQNGSSSSSGSGNYGKITIKECAFNKCSNLNKVVFGEGIVNADAFTHLNQLICSSLSLYQGALNSNIEIWTEKITLCEECSPGEAIGSGSTICFNKGYSQWSDFAKYGEMMDLFDDWGELKIIPPLNRVLIYENEGGLINIPESLNYKQHYTHNGLKFITFSKIPDKLPDEMFKNAKLNSISLPEGILSLGKSCFENCGLTNIKLPDSVETIDENCFFNNSFKEITFGKNLITINTDSLKESISTSSVILRFRGDVPFLFSEISSNDGHWYDTVIFYITDQSIWNDAGKYGSKWNDYLKYLSGTNVSTCNYVEDSSAKAYKVIEIKGNVNLLGGHDGFYRSENNIDDKNVYITEQITQIPSKLFSFGENHNGDFEIIFPEGITTIGDGEDPVINVGGYLFGPDIKFPTTLTTIRNKAFKGLCSNNLTIPANVTNIGTEAFVPSSEHNYTKLEILTDAVFDKSVFYEYHVAAEELVVPYEYLNINWIPSSSNVEHDFKLFKVFPDGYTNVSDSYYITYGNWHHTSSPNTCVLNYDWTSDDFDTWPTINYIVPEIYYGSYKIDEIPYSYVGDDAVYYSYLIDSILLKWDEYKFWRNSVDYGFTTISKPKYKLRYTQPVDEKYLVPSNFNGKIGESETILIGTAVWDNNLKMEEYTPESPESQYLIKVSVEINNNNSKTATKITIDDSTQYFDSTEHGVNFVEDNYSNFPNKICVSTVPYKIQTINDEECCCLIYDDLKVEDVFCPRDTTDVELRKYQYYISGSQLKLYMELSKTDDYKLVEDSIKVYEIKNGVLYPVGLSLSTDGSDDSNYSDKLETCFNLLSVPQSKFGFISFLLNSEYRMLPIYFGMTKDKWVGLDGTDDFSKLYFNEFDIPDSSETNSYACTTSYPYIFKDYNKNIVFQSKRPFLWHSVKDYFGTTDGGTNYGYYGCAKKEDISINLSKFKLVDGNRYSIKLGDTYLERNKEFHSDDTTLQNAEGDIVWTGQVINGQNVTKYEHRVYTENDSNPEFCDTICKRDYMLKYAGCPMTVNVEEEYGWTKEMADYAGWTDVGNINSLFISKSAGKNPYVRIGVDSINNLKNSDNGHSKAIECTSSTQVLNKVKQAHSNIDGDTTQFVTPVICKLTTKKNGFILPIPKDWTQFSYLYEKILDNKKNRGTDSAVVLTRQTKALQIDQAIFQAFMSIVSAGVVAGGVIGGIAIGLALGVASVSAVGMAIPIVGWAIAVIAALTACIYAILNYCKGVDQKFDFFALKGTGNNLIMPIWGKVNVKNRGKHPFYTNVDPNMIEKMLLFLYTRVYRISSVKESGGHLVETDEIEVVDSQPLTLELYGRSLEERFDFVQECITLAKLLNINTNNFTEKSPKEFEEIVLSTTNTYGVENRFKDIIRNQQLTNKEDAEHVGKFSFESCGNNDINNNVSRFVSNLTLNDIDNSDSWAYDINKGTINTNAQECFGGNRGGCNVDLKVAGWGNSWFKRLMSGEFPHKKDGFIPVAYPAKVGEDPILSTCPTDIYAEHIYKIDRENNRDDEYLTWVVNTKSNEI